MTKAPKAKHVGKNMKPRTNRNLPESGDVAASASAVQEEADLQGNFEPSSEVESEGDQIPISSNSEPLQETTVSSQERVFGPAGDFDGQTPGNLLTETTFTPREHGIRFQVSDEAAQPLEKLIEESRSERLEQVTRSVFEDGLASPPPSNRLVLPKTEIEAMYPEPGVQNLDSPQVDLETLQKAFGQAKFPPPNRMSASFVRGKYSIGVDVGSGEDEGAVAIVKMGDPDELIATLTLEQARMVAEAVTPPRYIVHKGEIDVRSFENLKPGGQLTYTPYPGPQMGLLPTGEYRTTIRISVDDGKWEGVQQTAKADNMSVEDWITMQFNEYLSQFFFAQPQK